MSDKEKLNKTEPALHDVICPAVYVSRAFGLGPYKFTDRGSPSGYPRLIPSISNCAYSLFWMTLYTWIVVTSVMRFSGQKKDKPVLGATETGKVLVEKMLFFITNKKHEFLQLKNVFFFFFFFLVAQSIFFLYECTDAINSESFLMFLQILHYTMHYIIQLLYTTENRRFKRSRFSNVYVYYTLDS